MQIGEVEKLKNERKWSQLCDAIIESVDTNPIEQLVNIFLECVSQIHPKSSCGVFLMLSDKLPPEEGIKILTTGREMLDRIVLYSEDFDVEKAAIEIKKCLLLVELGELKGIEKKLFEWKSLKMPRSVSSMYNILGFRFYEKVQNVENALVYLLRYTELCPEEDTMDVLVRYALLSKDFFNFTSITSLPGFNTIKNKSLERIFLLFREGDIEGLKRNNEEFDKMFGDEANAVREKIYIVALLNLCFAEPSKKVHLEKIENSLNISNRMSVYIILKSFGLGLIEGWINGENRTMHFNSLIPRTLQIDEIARMKDRFNIWEHKVREVISILE